MEAITGREFEVNPTGRDQAEAVLLTDLEALMAPNLSLISQLPFDPYLLQDTMRLSRCYHIITARPINEVHHLMMPMWQFLADGCGDQPPLKLDVVLFDGEGRTTSAFLTPPPHDLDIAIYGREFWGGDPGTVNLWLFLAVRFGLLPNGPLLIDQLEEALKQGMDARSSKYSNLIVVRAIDPEDPTQGVTTRGFNLVEPQTAQASSAESGSSDTSAS
jgi:hypothetical protein